MNRRSFFKGLLAAGCLAVGRLLPIHPKEPELALPPPQEFSATIESMLREIEHALFYGCSTGSPREMVGIDPETFYA